MWDYVCVYITNADSKALQKLEAIATGNSIRCIEFPAFSRPYILSEDFLLLHAAQIASLTAETDTGMKYLPAVNTSHLHQLSASILSLSDNTVVFPKTSYQNLTALKLIDVMSSVSDAFYSSLDHLATSTGRLREITLIFRLRCVEMRVEPITALIRANRSTLLETSIGLGCVFIQAVLGYESILAETDWKRMDQMLFEKLGVGLKILRNQDGCSLFAIAVSNHVPAKDMKGLYEICWPDGYRSPFAPTADFLFLRNSRVALAPGSYGCKETLKFLKSILNRSDAAPQLIFRSLEALLRLNFAGAPGESARAREKVVNLLEHIVLAFPEVLQRRKGESTLIALIFANVSSTPSRVSRSGCFSGTKLPFACREYLSSLVSSRLR
jgi:hypothetical protein